MQGFKVQLWVAAERYERNRASLFAVVAWNQVQKALSGMDPVIPDARIAAVARQRLPPGVAAVLTTSGSTGQGRHVVLSAEALIFAAESFQQRYGPATWSCALPTDYVAGFMTLVRASVAGTQPRLVRADLGDLSPANGTNAISLVPTQLYRALADPGLVAKLAQYEIILIGGSRIPPTLLDQATSAGLTLTTSYGMTETCGGCVFDGIPLPGTQIGLADETGETVFRLGRVDSDTQWQGENPNNCGTVEQSGRILVAGPQLFSEYLDDPVATANTLIGDWLRTKDRGLVENSQLKVLGRMDSVVISGGVNVDLDQVNRVLEDEQIPAVVVGVADPEWGTRIILVAEPGRTLAQWKGRLSERLGAPALPKELVEVAKLPRSDRGKIDRAALLKLMEGT